MQVTYHIRYRPARNKGNKKVAVISLGRSSRSRAHLLILFVCLPVSALAATGQVPLYNCKATDKRGPGCGYRRIRDGGMIMIPSRSEILWLGKITRAMEAGGVLCRGGNIRRRFIGQKMMLFPRVCITRLRRHGSNKYSGQGPWLNKMKEAFQRQSI